MMMFNDVYIQPHCKNKIDFLSVMVYMLIKPMAFVRDIMFELNYKDRDVDIY